MAKNKTAGDKPRKGAVKSRSQIENSLIGTWTKPGHLKVKKAKAKP